MIEDESGKKHHFKYIAGVAVAPNDDIIVADNRIIAFTADGLFKVSPYPSIYCTCFYCFGNEVYFNRLSSLQLLIEAFRLYFNGSQCHGAKLFSKPSLTMYRTSV